MAEQFAKLFDTANGQLLAYIDDEDGNEEQFSVRIIGALVRGVQPSAKLGYETEESRQRGFDIIDQQMAEQTALQLFNVANGLAAQGHSA